MLSPSSTFFQGLCLALSTLFLAFPNQAEAQLVNSQFGQNRIQYKQEKWYRYETTNFAFAYTEATEPLLRFLVPLVEADYAELKLALEYQVRNKIEVLVYADYSDYLQSNVGLGSPAQGNNMGGMTHLLDHKILLYFDGSHLNLRRQLRQGIARCLINRMMFGSSLQEVVQNSVLMHLPPWFTEGIVAYATEEWNSEADNRLREILLSGRANNFFALAELDPKLAGHSLFHFTARNHGPNSVSTLLYLTRINRNVENGFLYVFGGTYYGVLSTSWFNYYSKRYNSDAEDRRYPAKGQVEVKLPRKAEIKHLRLSPDARYLAWVEHKHGQQEVRLHDLQTKNTKTIYKGGLRDRSADVDRHYPLISWSYTGKQLHLVYEHKDKVYLRNLQPGSAEAGEKRKPEQDILLKDLERIISINPAPKGDLILAAIQDGQSDLYFRRSNGKLEAITQDFWDDLEGTYIELDGQAGIVIRSNRQEASLKAGMLQSDRLPYGRTDLFFLPLNNLSGMARLTQTPWAEEARPVAWQNRLAFISDANGIRNRYFCQLDTVLTHYERVFVQGTEILLQVHADSLDKLEAKDTARADSGYWAPQYRVEGRWSASSNFSRSLEDFDLSPEKGKVVELLMREGKYQIFLRDLDEERSEMPLSTEYAKMLEKPYQHLKPQAAKPQPLPLPKPSPKDSAKTKEESEEEEIRRLEAEIMGRQPKTPLNGDTSRVDIDNYFFQSEFQEPQDPTKPAKAPKPEPGKPAPIILSEGEDGRIRSSQPEPKPAPNPVLADNNKPRTKLLDYEPGRKQPYRNLFRMEEFGLQMDNTPLFWDLNMYLGGYYQFQPLGMMLKTSYSDVFEHYNLEIGARLPFNFNGMEYFVVFEDRKHLIDKKYTFYRRGRTNDYLLVDTTTGFQLEAKGRNIKHLAQAEFKYPLNKFASLRATTTMQVEKVAILAEEINTLNVPVYNESRMGLRLEYVYDNSRSMGLNTKKGLKFRAFMDAFNPLSVQTVDGFKISLAGGYTGNLGLDLRYYLPLDKRSILAFRLAGASSWGKQRILYSLGGVENWIFSSFNETIPLPNADNFAFQTIAANMRGFQSNARNGNAYTVLNSEIRIPLSEYLGGQRARSSFFRNLQLIGFADVGTAWQGLSPFSKDNPLNTTTIDNSGPNAVSPVRVRVNYFRRPILSSYGFGMRTIVLGYFLRLDYGWGVETGAVQSPRLHVSIGMDF